MATRPSVEPRSELAVFLEQETQKELLRFTTAGSVDDGKSTLIGRLLHDCQAVYEDQLDSIKKSRVNRSGRTIDFSLLTDGLRAEREQGITIDVAYRYFSTPKRKFIIADTPGHEQYTRNMATGASTADLAILLIDASKGLLPQTRRHAYIAALLGIDTVVAAVNKMDLLDYREDSFRELKRNFCDLAQALGIPTVQCIPISALDGDNIVTRSERTRWYEGPTLLEHLETVPLRASRGGALRLPVQLVLRPDATFRGFAGRIASGQLHRGDELLALPSRQTARVASLASFDGDLASATAGESVVVKLTDEIDISRGDILVSPGAEPHVSDRFSAMVVWLHSRPLELHRTYLAKHAGREVKARATDIRHGVDVNQLTHYPTDRLEMNGIGLVSFETSQPLYFDAYRTNRTTGSLILIDPLTNATVGAAMIRDNLAGERNGSREEQAQARVSFEGQVTAEARIERRGHRPGVFVLGSVRAAEAVEMELFSQGFDAVLLDCSHISAAVWEPLLGTLLRAGLIAVICALGELTSEQTGFFPKLAGISSFDLSAFRAGDAADTAAMLAETTRLAATLRVRKAPSFAAEN